MVIPWGITGMLVGLPSAVEQFAYIFRRQGLKKFTTFLFLLIKNNPNIFSSRQYLADYFVIKNA